MKKLAIGPWTILGGAALCLYVAIAAAQSSDLEQMMRRSAEDTRHDNIVASLDSRKRAEDDRHKQMLDNLAHVPPGSGVSQETQTADENELHANIQKQIDRDRAIEDRRHAEALAAIGGGASLEQAPGSAVPGSQVPAVGTGPEPTPATQPGNPGMLQGGVSQSEVPGGVGEQAPPTGGLQPQPVEPPPPDTRPPSPMPAAPRPPVTGPAPTRVTPALPPYIPVQPVLPPPAQPSGGQTGSAATPTPIQPAPSQAPEPAPSYPAPTYIREHLIGNARVPIPGSANQESISIDVPSDFPVGASGPGLLTQNEPHPYYGGYYGYRASNDTFVITKLEDMSGRWTVLSQPLQVPIAVGGGR